MTLEKKLVRLRKKEGMSQADVSEKLDVSRQAVSRWESGDSRPSTENLQALCKLYNVKLDDLLDESNEEVPIENTECQKAEIYYPSNYNDFKVSFAITAEGNGGKRGEVYLIGVGLYDSQHENRRIYFYDAASISLTGKVSWNCSDTFEDKLTEFCYLRYFGVKDFAVSYNSTVS